MLGRLRNQAFQKLAATTHCTLSTVGPAGLCASNVALVVAAEQVYILIPNTSDHLFNLEENPAVALTAETWQLAGNALLTEAGEAPFSPHQTDWCVVFRVTPQHMHLAPDDEEPTPRTVDF